MYWLIFYQKDSFLSLAWGDMMEPIIHYNRLGIPILEDWEIEEMAYDFVSHVDDTSLKTPCIAPIAGILDYMENAYNVRMSFHNLGNLDGYKILGRTIFPANRIYIDMDIIYRQESLFFFTYSLSGLREGFLSN